MRILQKLLFIGCLYGISHHANSQDSIHIQSPKRYLDAVNSRCDWLSKRIEKKTAKLLRKLRNEERRLKQKVQQKDSSVARRLFDQSESEYQKLFALVNDSSKLNGNRIIGNYIPYLDTLQTSLGFMNQINSGRSSSELEKLHSAVKNVEILRGKFDQAALIQQFLRQRRQYLKDQLSKLGLFKELKRLNKEVYYYSQMIRDYKELISDPKRIEKEVIKGLVRIPAFKKFFSQNSELASMFGIPVGTGNGNARSLTGVQTRFSAQQAIQNNGSGPNPAQFIQQQLQSANSQISEARNKISFVDLSGNPEPIPDFKTNQQKTKRFVDRIEFGANIQFGKVNQVLPASGDFAVSAAYKINDKSSIGIGSSYKLGIGTLKHIKFTHQGFGLRSFLDWQIKGGLYIAGGYERNYLPQLEDIPLAREPDTWQQSGLIGLTKKTQLGKNKNHFIQLLFDFLSYQNFPRSQPILFRTGFTF